MFDHMSGGTRTSFELTKPLTFLKFNSVFDHHFCYRDGIPILPRHREDRRDRQVVCKLEPPNGQSFMPPSEISNFKGIGVFSFICAKDARTRRAALFYSPSLTRHSVTAQTAYRVQYKRIQGKIISHMIHRRKYTTEVPS